MISCLHTCMHACCIISILPPLNHREAAVSILKSVIVDLLTGGWDQSGHQLSLMSSLTPPPTVNPFNPHSDPLIQSIFSLSSVYFRMTAAELLFFLQTLRGLEQCLLFDPWPVIHSHHVKRSHMGRIKLQWHINKYRWKIHYHWHSYSFSVNFKIFLRVLFSTFF